MNRFFAYFLSLLFVVGLVALDVAAIARSGEMRRQFDRIIRDNVKTRVEYGDISVTRFGEVRIYGINVFRSNSEKSGTAFWCDEARVTLDWSRFIRGAIEIDKLEVVNPSLYLTWTDNGRLDLPSFLESSETKARTPKLPNVVIKNLTVRAMNAPGFPRAQATFVNGIDVELVPYRARLFSYKVRGTIDDPVFGHFDVDGAFGEALLRGVLRRESFRLTSELTALLEPQLKDQLSRVKMDGSFDLELEFSAEDYHDSVAVAAKARAKNVGIVHDDFDLKIEKLNGDFIFADRRLRSEAVEFSLAGGYISVREGELDFSEGFPRWTIGARMAGLYLDRNFADSLRSFDKVDPDDLGTEIAGVLNAIDANGFVDIEFKLDHQQPNARVDVDVLVTFRETNISYVGFPRADGTLDGYPYQLQKVVGTVHVKNDGVEFHDVRSNDKHPDITADGQVFYGSKGFGFDLHIRGNSLRLDDKVRRCLQPSQREIYDSYDPDGPVDFTLDIAQPRAQKGADIDAKVDLIVDLLGVRVKPETFPYELQDLEGKLIFGRPEGVLVQNATARHGDTTVVVNGIVDMGRADGVTAYDLDIAATDVKIESDLMDAAMVHFPKVVEKLKPFNFTGAFDAKCRVASDPKIDNTFRANLRNVECDVPDMAIRFTEIAGIANVGNGRLALEGLTMNLKQNPFSAEGSFQLDDGGFYDLVLRSPEFQITDAFLARVGEYMPAVASLREEVDVEGKLDLTVNVRKNEFGEGKKTDIGALGLLIRGKKHPFLFTDVFGRVEVRDGSMSLTNWTAVAPYGPEADAPRASVNVRSGHWRESKGKSALTLSGIDVSGVVFEDRLYKMLGPTFGDGLKSLGARGTIAAVVDTVVWDGAKLRFSGRLSPHHVLLDPGFPIEWQKGDVVFEDGIYNDDELSIAGTTIDAVVKTGPFLLTKVEAAFRATKRDLEILSFGGEALGGRLNPESTRLHFSFDDGQPFVAALSLTKAELSVLVKELGGDPKKIDGRANVLVPELTGKLADSDTYIGTGTVNMSGERLYEAPVFSEIFSILNFDFLSANETQTASAQARIESGNAFLDKIQIRGPGISLAGEGRVTFDGVVNVSLDINDVTFVDKIPLIGEIFGFGRSFLVKSVEVTGPIEDPSASLGNRFTDLLPDEPDSGRRFKIKPAGEGGDTRPTRPQKK